MGKTDPISVVLKETVFSPTLILSAGFQNSSLSYLELLLLQGSTRVLEPHLVSEH